MNKLLTRKQAADILSVSPLTLEKWAVLGKNGLPFVKVGRAVRYKPADVEKFIERNTVGKK